MKKITLISVILAYLLFVTTTSAQSFSWPTSGYIGWLYGYDTQSAEGIHTGIDIWNNTSGGWTNNQIGNSNSIYSAASGTIVVRGDNPQTGDGYIIYHGPGLYTAYWHIINKTKNVNNPVNANELLGNQAMANTVHLHFAVLSSGQDNYTNSKDPSSYLGRQLKFGQPGAPGWVNTYVTAQASGGCGGANVTIQNQNISGNITCSATSTIQISPETNVNGDNVIFLIN